MKTLYEVLGVSERIAQAELKAAYHQRLRETHPDKGGAEGGGELVTQVRLAWQRLSEETSRGSYDAWLAEQRLRRSGLEFASASWGEAAGGVECRCGGEYRLESEDAECAVDECFLPCSNCSLSLRVRGKEEWWSEG